MPATPGLWQWHREGGVSVARFGDSLDPALFSMTCNPLAGTIGLKRRAVRGWGPAMTLSTTTLSRRIAIPPAGGGAVVVVSARDPLLDAMAFSRGRFAVEVPGLLPLYLPSWPEVSRVIEDCRRPPNGTP